MARRVQLIGGPLDGALVNWTDEPFVWVDPSTKLPGEPTPHSALYRLDGKRWRFAGYTHTLCDGCGCIHATTDNDEPVRTCQLCGGKLARTR